MPKEINVVGAVFLKDGSVFTAKRGAGKSMAGLWEFPGGKIEPGETPEAALARELREELLIEAEVLQPLETTRYKYSFAVVKLSTYLCEILSGTPVLTEHVEVRWVPIPMLPTLEWAPADVPTVDLLQKRFR